MSPTVPPTTPPAAPTEPLPVAGPSQILRWPRLRSIAALVLRDMSTQYGRSPGGYAWAVLEPLGAIVVLAIGFSLIMRTPSLGNSFILFYATGYLPYDLFQKLSGKIASAMARSKSLLAYPTVKWIDAIFANMSLITLTNSLVAFLLLAGVLYAQNINIIVSYPPILLGFALSMLLGTGIGLVNCVLGSFVPVWTSIWNILTRPLLIASGVILLYRDFPTFAQSILYYNPILHITSLTRTGFYPSYRPQFVSITYVCIWIVVLLALGLMLVRRYHREIINR